MAKRKRTRLGAFSMDDFDFAPDAPDDGRQGKRDACAGRLKKLNVGDVMQVGKLSWSVWRTRGAEAIVTKAGSKGRKLYALEVASLDPCCIEVREINPGSGDKLPGPAAAKGCAVDDTTWKGTKGRRR